VNARFSLLHFAALGLAAVASSAGTCSPDPVQTLDCASDADCSTNGRQNGTCDLNTKLCVFPAVSILTTATLPSTGATLTLERDANGRLRLPLAMVGASYKVKLQATGGDSANMVFSCNGGCSRYFTPGLYLDSAGLISGTPTSTKTDVCPTFAATSGGNKKTETFCLTVADRLPNRLTPSSPLDTLGNVQVSNALLNTPYKDTQTGQSVIVKITGGERAPYGISLDGGSLPPGLALSISSDKAAAYAKVTGTPTQEGTYFFSIKAYDAIYSVLGINDTSAANMITKMFSMTVLNCANASLVSGQCLTKVMNECTCAVSDPCHWSLDAKCQDACQRFHDRFDDLDCPNCADLNTVHTNYCAHNTYNLCTCGPSDPCSWRNNTICNSGCNVYYSHFDDSVDCLDCTNSNAVQTFCTAGTHNVCTCAASDPCGWRNNSKCDDACEAFSGAFDDSADCTSCSNSSVVQSACDNVVVNACTCGVTDPCGWKHDGFCDSECNVYGSHFDDSSDCMTCTDSVAVQAACDAGVYNKCTCASSDPCWWYGDGFCDTTMCSIYPSHFTDSYFDCNP
jgi:hypothetical protein